MGKTASLIRRGEGSTIELKQLLPAAKKLKEQADKYVLIVWDYCKRREIKSLITFDN